MTLMETSGESVEPNSNSPLLEAREQLKPEAENNASRLAFLHVVKLDLTQTALHRDFAYASIASSFL